MSTQPEMIDDVGYREFWPVIKQKYPKFFEVAQELGPIVDETFSQAHTEPLHKICRHLARIAANSLNAVLILGLNGYGYDAIKIARTMFESAAIIMYLRKHPDKIRDYMDYHFIVQKKRFEYMEKYSPDSLKRISAIAIKNAEAGYNRVIDRYRAKGRMQSWSKKSFREICAEVGLEEGYINFYSFASNLTHSNIAGIMAQTDSEPGALDVDIAPSEKLVDLAFQMAHSSFVIGVTEYISLARPGKQHISKRIKADLTMAWGKKELTPASL